MAGYVKSYYAGGARVVIGGVPIRLARAPSARDLADMRAWARYLESEPKCDTNAERQARAKTRALEARKRIELYAEMLGISVRSAKARIEKQRLHNLANPVLDLSLEYDL
jgi:hypothetical protein